MNPGVFFDFEARVLSCLGQAEETDFNTLSDQLLRLDTAKNKPITIYFSARGGNLMDALKVIDVLATLRSPTTGIAMGLNDGAAAAILFATKKRIMMPSAILFPGRLWNLPSQQPTVGLHAVSTDSLHSHLHRRLEQLDSQLPHLVRLVREAEKHPRFISAPEALRLGIISEIHGTEAINTRGPYVR